MTWQTTADLERYLAAAGQFLRSRPAEHTQPLTITQALRASGSNVFGSGKPFFGWWRDSGGGVASAFLQTPPHPILLTSAPQDAAAELADLLAGSGREPSAINVRAESAPVFTSQWRHRTGITPATVRRMRLYRLAGLNMSSSAVPGTARAAGPGDAGLLVSWYTAFGAEIGEEHQDVPGLVRGWITGGRMTLWADGGEPVSMAGATAPVEGVVRVAPVYTPPRLRRHGYAGAVTAAVSQAALDAGARDVVLFTDLANPASNSIYQRIGYRPVHDRAILSLAGS